MEDRSKIAVSLFNKNANLYEEKYMDISLYHNSLDLFCSTVNNENAEILEVACGPGNITSYLVQKQPEYYILGTDLAPKMIELAKRNNPTTTFKLLDCREISSLNVKFDAIISGFCLPYLSKEEAVQFIYDTATQLKTIKDLEDKIYNVYAKDHTARFNRSNNGRVYIIGIKDKNINE